MSGLSFTQKKNLQVRYEQYYSAVKFLDAETVTGTVEVPVIISEYGGPAPHGDLSGNALSASVNQLIVHKSNLVILNNLNDAMNETIKYVNDRLDEIAVVPKYLNKIASSNSDNIQMFADELTAYLNDISGSFVDAADGFNELSLAGEQYKFYGTSHQYPVYDISGAANSTPATPPPANTFSDLKSFVEALLAVTDWTDVNDTNLANVNSAPFADGFDPATAVDINGAANELSTLILAGIDAFKTATVDEVQTSQQQITASIDAISLDADSEEFYEEKQKLMRALKRRITVLGL
jgi:hypothetical protein